jgi:hypothetical protein
MITIKITKPVTRPFESPEPTTKVENAFIILPSKREPWVRIRRVDETLRARLKTVTIKRTTGNRVKSVGFLLYRTIRSTKRESIRFMDIRASRITVGRGMMNITTTRITPKGIKRFLVFITPAWARGPAGLAISAINLRLHP